MKQSRFFGKNNQFAFLSYQGPWEASVSSQLIIDGIVKDQWPYIEWDSLTFTESGEHYSYIANHYPNAVDKSKWVLVVDGKNVWEFDELVGTEIGYFADTVSPVGFDKTDKRIFCTGIKNNCLILFTYDL